MSDSFGLMHLVKARSRRCECLLMHSSNRPCSWHSTGVCILHGWIAMFVTRPVSLSHSTSQHNFTVTQFQTWLTILTVSLYSLFIIIIRNLDMHLNALMSCHYIWMYEAHHIAHDIEGGHMWGRFETGVQCAIGTAITKQLCILFHFIYKLCWIISAAYALLGGMGGGGGGMVHAWHAVVLTTVADAGSTEGWRRHMRVHLRDSSRYLARKLSEHKVPSALPSARQCVITVQTWVWKRHCDVSWQCVCWGFILLLHLSHSHAHPPPPTIPFASSSTLTTCWCS